MGYGGKTSRGLDDNFNTEPPVATVPLANENSPGLGRQGGTNAQQRISSGGLDDESPEEPVRNDSPSTGLHQGR